MFKVLHHRSGRVIALGRALLATVFLFAIWMDPSQPVQAGRETYALLGMYVVFCASIAVAIWNNWWLDAKLAAPVHILDIAVFTLLVVTTNGYTSPFFVFFVFLILSAAIRWGWRETAATAAAVILLYLSAGLLAEPSSAERFELQRFIVRSGHLLILSAILIWFGVNQGFSGLKLPSGNLLPEPLPDSLPLETAVRRALELAGARLGVLLWQPTGSLVASKTAIGPDGAIDRSVLHGDVSVDQSGPFLFDLKRNRALARSPERRMRAFPAKQAIGGDLTRSFDFDEGLAIPIRSEVGKGTLILGDIEGLATDHIELGALLGDAVARHLQSHALLEAVEQSASARTRLSLSRDLHDSIVQFLAGATFRIEAIARAIRSGESPKLEVEELKQLMLLEQQELRSAVSALRKEEVSADELAQDLQGLCDRLARQWDIGCFGRLDVRIAGRSLPVRLHLDMRQLIRESVANAVRHGKARSISVQVTVEDADLRIDISDDGRGLDKSPEGHPWSLHERVNEANGTLMLASSDSGTQVSITLPLSTERRP